MALIFKYIYNNISKIDIYHSLLMMFKYIKSLFYRYNTILKSKLLV